jgi:hypothetical protein
VLARHVMTQLELRRHARELNAAHEAGETTKDQLEKAHAENAQLRRELSKLKAKSSPRKNAKNRTVTKRK